MSIKVEVFDSRRNQLGEGPTATGENNNHIQWVDIYGQEVRWQNLESGQSGEYQTSEPVGFQIPRTAGGEILGTASGPVLRDKDGTLHKLPTRESANGMDWSVDKTKMFYIDTLSMKVDLFDYDSGQISNRRTLVEISDGMGYPDGMCSDSEDNIWVAFWMGSCVRGFDGKNGKQIAEIKVPAQKVTSCCFAGEKLDKLIITTALGNPDEKVDLQQYPESGFVFVASPGVVGKKTSLFGA